MRARRRFQACVAAAGGLLVPAAALCEDKYNSPALEDRVPWLAVIYLLVCLAGVCAVAFKNAKRTHLD